MPERGQASLDYLAVVALVGCVVALGAGAVHATGIGKAVTAQLARALCVVTGGACDADRLPCPTSWRRAERGWHVALSLFRFGAGWVEAIEERSDGTVVLTRGRTKHDGPEVAAAANIKLRGRTVGLSAAAGVASVTSSGRSWVLRSRAEAERVAAALERGDPVPEPAETYTEDPDWKLEAGASAGVPGKARAGVDVSHARIDGVRTDHLTGRRTTYRRGDWRFGGSASIDVKRKGSLKVAGASRHGRDDLAITREADGRPVELVLTRIEPGDELPAEVRGSASLMGSPGARQLVVLERRLDLTDAEARRAAEAYEAGADGSEEVLEALLARRGVLNVRAYRVDTHKGGEGVDVGGTVLRFAAGRERSSEQVVLVGAATRDLAGQWRRRDDCLA